MIKNIIVILLFIFWIGSASVLAQEGESTTEAPAPTDIPTLPTEAPTETPTEPPTEIPTSIPTETPTESPVPTLTETPVELPTQIETSEATQAVEIEQVPMQPAATPLEVLNTNADGPGSLSDAILFANAQPGQDTITFNIPGSGPHTIAPPSGLPEISDSVIIDGLSQPGATCENWPPTLKIEIQTGLSLGGDADNSLVRGLVVNNGGIFVAASNAALQCNFVGTDITGTQALGSFSAISVRGFNVLIGGIGSGTRNLISGNEYGIRAEETGSLTIQGNYIGTDVTGEFSLANTTAGIHLDTVGVMIGGNIPGAGNIISGNSGIGVFVTYDPDVLGSNHIGIIQGNTIGANPAGTKAVPNGQGIGVIAPMIIGGTQADEGNLISGNTGIGISVSGGGDFPSSNSPASLVHGNFIGTDVTGVQALGNGTGVSVSDGVILVSNVISGNLGNGVEVTVSLEPSDVSGNLIGVAADTITPLGNGGDGVAVVLASDFTSPNISDNRIAHNGGSGVSIIASDIGGTINPVPAALFQNRIFSNGKLGIDLGSDGVTLNDTGDSDAGAHGLQNFPVLDAAIANTTSVTGTLNTLADGTFGIEIFANTVCDPSGYGEGEVSIGTTTVTTDASGNASFTVTTSSLLAAGQFITARVTDGIVQGAAIGTSEFSKCSLVIQPPANPLEVFNTNAGGPGSLTSAILFANGQPGQDTITFNIPGDGPHTIAPPSSLPDITDSVIVDGLSQPGASCQNWPPTLKIEVQTSLTLSDDADVSTIRGLVINNGGISVIGARDATIQCNFIGTDITGTQALGSSNGIFVRASDTLIGGIGPGTRNLISGNGSGISAVEPANELTIQGNYIGTDVTGELALGGGGISLDTAGAVIGETTPGAGNVISGNGCGICITYDQDVVGDFYVAIIQGNYIGTNASGIKAVPNGGGLGIVASVLVGGTETGARNLISGNSGTGISVFTPENNNGHTSVRNSLVQGNYIGTDITGMQPLGNGGGVSIGDNVNLENNVISGNLSNGVDASNFQEPNTVRDNLIGVAADGSTPLGNGGDGVTVSLSSDFAAPGVSDNTIAYNGGSGIAITTNTTSSAFIVPADVSGNRIFSNGKLGIDLGSDGVTLNDSGDTDEGANGLQNFPALTTAIAGTSSVSGTLNTLPNAELGIAVFTNSACDPSGYGEGEIPIGTTSVTTNASGNVSFSVTTSTPLAAGQFITALVTSGFTPNTAVGTSEFSACLLVGHSGPPAPALLSPSDGVRVTVARPSFSWRAVTGAVRYRLQVSGTMNFSTVLLDAESDSTSAAPGILPQGIFYWRVQARDRQGNWWAFSAFRSFELNILQSPANATDTAGTNPTFHWFTYTGARRYQLQIDDDIGFANPNFTCERTHKQTLSCTPSQPLPYGDYVWRVNIDTGQGFVTSPISWRLSIRLKNLLPPGLLAPANGATTEAQPTLSWNAVSGAAFYQIQIDNDRDYSSLEDAGSGNFLSYTAFAALPPGTYYWRVRALNSALQPGGWSGTRLFRVG